jgi:hypothetical protein
MDAGEEKDGKNLSLPTALKSKEVNPDEAQDAYKKQRENTHKVHKTFIESRMTMREGIIRTLERKMSP